MTDQQWEEVYWLCCKRDYENKIYAECDNQDRKDNS